MDMQFGFECRELHVLTRSMQSMRPQPVSEREASEKAEVMAYTPASITSRDKRVYEVKGDAAATDDEEETHGQTAKRQKRSETRVDQEQAVQEQEIQQPNPALSRAARARAREQKDQEAKARVAYHQYRVDWILSEISKIEVEQKSTTGESTGLAEMGKRKTTSEASMDGPADKEKMSNNKSDDSPTAQAGKLLVVEYESVSGDDAVPEDEAAQDNVAVEDNEGAPEHSVGSEDKAFSENEVVLESQAKTSNKPSTENPGFPESKDVSTQFYERYGNVNLESAAVSSATGDYPKIYNDGPKTLQSSTYGDVAVTASILTEVNETQTPKASSPSHAPNII